MAITGPKPKHQFTQKLREKGYSLAEFARIIGYTMSGAEEIARNPKTGHWLMINGLPEKEV